MGKTAIIIPARFNSSRLLGKLLLEVQEKPIIQWVWEAARQSKLADDVIIATDSEEIFNRVFAFGAKVEMTSTEHKSGSDRICEVAQRHPEFDNIINLQGDEPSITPDVIDSVICALDGADISTLVRKIEPQQVADPNCVKCVFDNFMNALYFSRSPIPYERNKTDDIYGHIGIYGYTREALLKMTSLPQSSLELAESLEQLRALQNGLKIKVAIVEVNPIGIDTQEDYEKFKRQMAK